MSHESQVTVFCYIPLLCPDPASHVGPQKSVFMANIFMYLSVVEKQGGKKETLPLLINNSALAK